MGDSVLSAKLISEAVTEELAERKWSLRHCAKEFNARHKEDIASGDMKPMTKDVVLRVKNNSIELTNHRVLSLCSFLGVDVYQNQYVSSGTRHMSTESLIPELRKVEDMFSKNPQLRKKIKSLLRNLVDIASINKGA